MEEIDTLQAARLFIERFGNGAQMAVARRIDRARRNGDPYGAMMWRRVSHAIRDLERTRNAPLPPGSYAIPNNMVPPA